MCTNSRGNTILFQRAFSLVEMLLVVAITGILIALLLPALTGARDTALRVSTASMMADLTNAAQRFENDNAGRSPGYFSQKQMGHSENEGIGMTAMENAMIELGGTSVIVGRSGDPGVNPDVSKGLIEVTPRSDTDPTTGVIPVVININNIGAEGAYYTPDPAQWKTLVHTAGAGGQQAGNPFGNGQELMPDLVDAWGNPLLLWSQDTSARGSILVEPGASEEEVYTQFVRINSDGNGDPGDIDGPAWFYINSNAGYLEAPNFGSAGFDMAANPSTGAASTIASGVGMVNGVDGDMERLHSLATALASPSAYILDPNANSLADASFEEVFPQRPRGKFIVHSAGTDGIYFSSQDEGWKTNAHSEAGEFHLDFGNNYFTQGNVRLTNDEGAFTNIDLIQDFDDIIVGSK